MILLTTIHNIAENWPDIILWIVVGVALIYSFLELFGVFTTLNKNPLLKYLKRRETAIQLFLIVGMVILVMRIDGDVTEIRHKSQEISGIVDGIDEKVQLIEELENIKSDFDPILDSLFGEDMEEKIRFFDEAINKGRYTIFDKSEFTVAYYKTLTMFPNAHALATSLADSAYFWSTVNESPYPFELEIKKFIDNGGKMTRFFYVDQKTLLHPRTKGVLERQLELGVTVYTVDKKNLSQDLFVVYEKQDFGWIVDVDETKNFTTFLFTRNNADLRRFRDEVGKLVLNTTCKQFTKDTDYSRLLKR